MWILVLPGDALIVAHYRGRRDRPRGRPRPGSVPERSHPDPARQRHPGPARRSRPAFGSVIREPIDRIARRTYLATDIENRLERAGPGRSTTTATPRPSPAASPDRPRQHRRQPRTRRRRLPEQAHRRHAPLVQDRHAPMLGREASTVGSSGASAPKLTTTDPSALAADSRPPSECPREDSNLRPKD